MKRIAQPSPAQSLAILASAAILPAFAAAMLPSKVPTRSSMLSEPILSLPSQYSLKFHRRSWLIDFNNSPLQASLGEGLYNGQMPALPPITRLSSEPAPATREGGFDEGGLDQPKINMSALEKDDVISFERAPAEPPLPHTPNDVLADGRPIYSSDRLMGALAHSTARVVIVETDDLNLLNRSINNHTTDDAHEKLSALRQSGFGAVAFFESTLFEPIRRTVMEKTDTSLGSSIDHTKALMGPMDGSNGLPANLAVASMANFAIHAEAMNIRTQMVLSVDNTVRVMNDRFVPVMEEAAEKYNWFDQMAHRLFGKPEDVPYAYQLYLKDGMSRPGPHGEASYIDQFRAAIQRDKEITADNMADLAGNQRLVVFTTKGHDPQMQAALEARFGTNNISQIYASENDEMSYNFNRKAILSTVNERSAQAAADALPGSANLINMPKWSSFDEPATAAPAVPEQPGTTMRAPTRSNNPGL